MKHWIARTLASLFMVGVIVEVQASPLRYKVQFDDNRQSNWLIPIALVASQEKHWCPLDIGSQVLVLMPFNQSKGFVLGGIWQSKFPQPQSDLDVFYREFADGTVMSYHRTNQELYFATPGKVIGTAQGGLTFTGDISITGNVTIAGEMNISGTVESNTEIIAKGIKLTKHQHKDVSAGNGISGEPV